VNIDPALLTETTEQAELRAVVRDLLTGDDEKLWARLATEVGVHGLAIPEQYGGSGYTFAELAVVLEETGRTLTCSSLLPTIVLAANTLLLSGNEQACERYLPRIADGTLTATVACFHSAPTVHAEPDGSGWLLRGSTDFVLDGQLAELVLVRAATAGGDRLFALESSVEGVTSTPRRVLDESRPLALLEFSNAPATLLGSAEIVEAVLDTGRAALAAEQVGGIAHALDATVSYVRQRHQFDRPIGSFQAVKHRLADLLVELEAARSASAYATACVTAGSPELPIAASAAAVVCSAAFQLATAEYVQLHGGIGFTWEHPAHRYVRRARAGEVLLGDQEFHRARLAAALSS
jgi:alkylation response protein AidB-like acyl-CoA dehydrogenase